jgi:hypothetical protein
LARLRDFSERPASAPLLGSTEKADAPPAFSLEKGRQREHILEMIKTLPEFRPEMLKGGRWFVAVKTGNGPDSHIGDFDTEAEAKDWILTKSKYWPGKPGNA